ncbi:MAG TPA: hypothetical protein ENK48_06730 [Gammaproteobacteria bacterium]|nr:hypothetical protein [Gammaproteobacteria bacterium]
MSAGPRRRHREEGAVLILMMLVLLVATVAFFAGHTRDGMLTRHIAAKTGRALALARDALMGYAVRLASRPGGLPCPDVDNDGLDDPLGTGCASRLGRLPWRALGSGDLRDGSGERLWYAVSASLVGTAGVLNSNTPGGLSVDGTGGVAAVIIAPLGVVDGQVRNAATINSVIAYLEGDNATSGDDSYAGSGPAPFRDQLLPLTEDELMRVVAQRVMGEVRSRLQAYYALNGYYPYAASFGDGPAYYCDQGVRKGHPPLAIGAAFTPGSGNACAGAAPWPTAWPAWFTANDWASVLFYTVAAPCTPGTVACGGGGAMLTVTTLPPPGNDKQALLIAGGSPLAGQGRPPLGVADLLEGAENTDGDDVYEQPAPGAGNDQVMVVAP